MENVVHVIAGLPRAGSNERATILPPDVFQRLEADIVWREPPAQPPSCPDNLDINQ